MKKDIILGLQKTEITEHVIYHKLANRCKSSKNKKILKHIADDELQHYKLWKNHTKTDVQPNRFKIWKYYMISLLFGLTFGIKLMGRKERKIQKKYIPETKKIREDEHKHERALINLIEEERLVYMGSIVLGLNDALVELTGALAGLTFALQNTRLIGIVGLITGIAASLSMAASEYLSTKTEKTDRNPFKSSLYTGTAYIITVAMLIIPYLLLSNVFTALATMLGIAITIILLFTFYNAVSNNLSFGRKFFEMAGISMSIALISFGIGIAVKNIFGV